MVTHGHYDHIGAVEKVVNHMGVPVITHEDAAKMMADPIRNLSTYFTSRNIKAAADRFVRDGETLDLGAGLVFKVMIVPGHSPKSVCFYNEVLEAVFTGDTLFAGSIGRTDYYDGNRMDLVKNIQEKLMFLPGNTKVYPGHGKNTTIANEKADNPYLNGRDII